MNSSSMAGGKRGSQVAQDDLRGGAVIAKEPVGSGRCGELSHAEFQDEKLEKTFTAERLESFRLMPFIG